MTLNDFYVSRIYDFVKKNAPYYFSYLKERGEKNPSILIKDLIRKHIETGTIVVLWNEGEVIALTTFRINAKTMFVTHCVVHPDYRFNKLLSRMSLVAIQRYPYLEEINFYRYFKDKEKKLHKINIARLLKPAIKELLEMTHT